VLDVWRAKRKILLSCSKGGNRLKDGEAHPDLAESLGLTFLGYHARRRSYYGGQNINVEKSCT